MILVDTSVVIDYLRSADPSLLKLFQSNGAAICGVTRAEVLHGARSDAEIPKLIQALDAFGQVSIPDEYWNRVGANLQQLRRAGIAVPFTDALIATVAIESGVELWTRDAQFSNMQGVLHQLKLFDERP